MMYPILCKVRYESLHHIFAHRQIWKQIAFSIFLNWIIAPLFMVSCPRAQVLGRPYGLSCSDDGGFGSLA